MKSYVEVLTTPTADTQGTSLLLEFQDKRYFIGNAHEGCQRAAIQRGKKLNKISEVFLTGKVEWKNTGGLLGLALTTADSRQAARKAAIEVFESKKKAKLQRLDQEIQDLSDGSKQQVKRIKEREKELKLVAEVRAQTQAEGSKKESLGVHGGPNLAYTVATARRFIFRKGMPLNVHESTTGTDPKDWKPTWQDENIQVYSMPVLPEILSPDATSSAGNKRKRDYEAYLGRVNAPLTTTSDDENQQLVQAVVSSMFDSDWTLDGLTETWLADVQMPAAIFYRDEKEKKIKPWTGPKPGEVPEAVLPRVSVLVRKPWPGAMIAELPPSKPSPVAMSYIFKNHPQRGKFQPEIAEELNIPVRKFGQLTSGESVTLDDGRTIQPEQVLAPGKPGSGFAVIELPSCDYVKPLLARKEWESSVVMDSVEGIFWILGPGVAENEEVQAFMKRLNKMKHVLTSSDHSANYIVFESSASATMRLAAVDPVRFPYPRFSNSLQAPLQGSAEIDFAHPGQTMNLEPRFSWDVSTKAPLLDTPKVISGVPINITDAAAKVWEHVNSASVKASLAKQSLPGLDNELITLGTGSAAPSKYRNVSATLLRVPGIGSYLLDAGENTLGQLARMYSPEQLHEILLDLRLIWISHMHADHHLGITSMIKAWYNARYPSGTEPDAKQTVRSVVDSPAALMNKDKLAVISSQHMIQWLREYSQIEDYGWDRVVGLEVHNTGDDRNAFKLQVSGGEVTMAFNDRIPAVGAALSEMTGLVDLRSVMVQHCHGARAVSLSFADGFKISYSGDCRPSARFVSIGEGSTVLLHEATFEDELKGDAWAKKHSTTTEAIQVGLAMNAPRILLTHFSQRYQKIPNMTGIKDRPSSFEDVTEEAAADEPIEQPDVDLDIEDKPHSIAAVANSDDTMEVLIDGPAANDIDFGAPGKLQARPQPLQTSHATAENLLGGVKVAVAFDHMRVKVRDLAIVEQFNPVISALIEPPVKEPVTDGDVQ